MLTAFTCSLVAALGYAMYGSAVREIVTFNLPRVSPHSGWSPHSSVNCRPSDINLFVQKDTTAAGFAALQRAQLSTLQGYLSLAVSCLILVSPWAKFALSAEPIAVAIDGTAARFASGEHA